ncbi:branched-chain amino acid aminotransferase [Undibacterium cyanobacteriorum]|uniref:branched-chain-amino-acid transaminase n=1 Tax=Undibacterium cyanobacteriorum TaxID=3073561 RepID=A0ABY9RGU9_9BURK|nr:branched-chain amino acid aminotransferase [Undibacterium sp. 20NA77.5]WMW80459.1 branched-chain amino acid aminotransferase [Undibacterium sp. 20NA77.5]
MYLTFVDGEWHEGNVPLMGAMDHSVWLGSSVFDGARAVAGRLPDLRLHLERSIRSAQALGLECPYDAEQMEALCREGVKRFPADAELYIRPLIFGRDGLLVPTRSGFALTLFDAPVPHFAGFSACLSSLQRPSPNMAPTIAKASCLYPNTTRALVEAKQRGFDNAVVCDPIGNVAEFATANLFFVDKDGHIVTPVANGCFLSGITRARVIKLLSEAGHVVHERSVKPSELLEAREIFNTGNFAKVMPCTRFEDHEMPVGPIVQTARRLYWEFMANT